jgi:hypothetical protein
MERNILATKKSDKPETQQQKTHLGLLHSGNKWMRTENFFRASLLSSKAEPK